MNVEEPMSPPSPNATDGSIGKALAVLDALGAARLPALGVSQVATATGMPKSTTHRVLAILIESGYVRRSGEKYALSTRLFELGNRVTLAGTRGLRERATPFIAELFAQTRETIHLGVLAGSDVLYVDKVYDFGSARPNTAIGMRRPAHATALGKALLAYASTDQRELNLAGPHRRFTAYTIVTPSAVGKALAQVRDQGCATDNEESFLGVSCIAVPVLDPRNNEPIAAMSITTTAGSASMTRYKGLLMGTARQLATQLSRLSAGSG